MTGLGSNKCTFDNWERVAASGTAPAGM
jgi:hypothetical protein